MKFLVTLFFLFLILLFSFSKVYFSDINQKIKNENIKKIPVNIPLWTPIKKLWNILKEKWVIDHKWTFFLYLKLNKLEWKIQAWDYIFNTPIWIKDLSDQLQNAKQEEIRIVIPEWSTIDDIDYIISNKWLIKKWEFIKCTNECKFPNHNFFFDWNIEWYLFPDTYFVELNNFKVKKFIKRLLNNFEKKILTNKFKKEYKKQWKKISDIIIMASIIEREERNVYNMPIVSWILWKRIKEWIPIWADATTRYYKKSKQWYLLKSDFEKDNPYNTRRNRWLPPTAISNPWIDAINASLYPKHSEYYYYLHDSSWQIHYSKTNNEHNFKKFKYIKAR